MSYNYTIFITISWFIIIKTHHKFPSLQQIVLTAIIEKKIPITKELFPDELSMQHVACILASPTPIHEKITALVFWKTLLKDNHNNTYVQALISDLEHKSYGTTGTSNHIQLKHLLYHATIKPSNIAVIDYVYSRNKYCINMFMPNNQPFLEYIITCPQIRPYRIIKTLHKKYSLDLSDVFFKTLYQSHTLFQILLEQIYPKALLQITYLPGTIESRKENLLFLKNYIEQQTGMNKKNFTEPAIE